MMLEKINGPQPKFEKMPMNNDEDELQTKRNIQTIQNTYREGDILNIDSNVDLKTTKTNQDYEKMKTEQQQVELNIRSMTDIQSLQNIKQTSYETKLRQSEKQSHQVEDDNTVNKQSGYQQNYSNDNIISKGDDQNREPSILKKRTFKESREVLAVNSLGNHIIKKGMNQKSSSSNLPQIIDLKLVNQLKRKMVYFYKIFTVVGRKDYFNQEQIRKMIGDRSDVFQITRGKILSRFICQVCIMSLKNIDFIKNSKKYLINPHSTLNFWLQLVLAIYNAGFLIGLSIMVIYINPEQQQQIIYSITYAVWLIEILLHLNTQIYDTINLISDRQQIMSNYIKKRSAFDLIPFLLLLILPENKIQRMIFQCLTYLKLGNVYSDITEIQKKLCMLVKNYYVIQLVNLILKLLIIGHVIACMWYLVGQIELHILKEAETWYDKGIGDDHAWWKLYLESFYWSLTLLTTGSNTATTVLQMFFTTFIMLFTTILFGYLLNVTGIIISQLDKQDEDKRLDLNILNDYMRSNKVSKILQTKVNIDLDCYYQNDMDKIQQDKSLILNKISPHLQNQLKYEYCCQILQSIEIVKSKFSEDTIQELSNHLQEEFHLPNSNIFRQNESQVSLIFIMKGQVELSQSLDIDHTKKKFIRLVNQGELIGQSNFFSGTEYDKNAKSTKFTKLIKINRDKFLEIIQTKQKDLETFCQIRDQVLMYENYDAIKEVCYFCKNSVHLERDCPLVHLSKTELYYRNRFFQNINQTRSQQKKRIQIKTNTLNQTKDICFEVKKFRKLLKKQLRENDNQVDFGLSYLASIFESDGLSSVENENYSQMQTSDFNIQKGDDQKEEFRDDYSKSLKSQKRYSSGMHELYPHKQMSQITYSNNINNMNTIELVPQEPQIINQDDLKAYVSKKSNNQYKKNSSFQLKSGKQQQPQLQVEDDKLNKRFSQQIRQLSMTNNTPQDPETNSAKHQALNQSNTPKEKHENEKILHNFPETDDIILRDFKSKKYDTALNKQEFDKMKEYTRYFPSGNIKVILIKFLKFQRKRQKPTKRSKAIQQK